DLLPPAPWCQVGKRRPDLRIQTESYLGRIMNPRPGASLCPAVIYRAKLPPRRFLLFFGGAAPGLYPGPERNSRPTLLLTLSYQRPRRRKTKRIICACPWL